MGLTNTLSKQAFKAPAKLSLQGGGMHVTVVNCLRKAVLSNSRVREEFASSACITTSDGNSTSTGDLSSSTCTTTSVGIASVGGLTMS